MTKKERRVTELHLTLPPISTKQKNWAIKKISPKWAYQCKDEIWCTACGRTFGIEWYHDGECPYCHEKIQHKKTRTIRCNIREYFSIITRCKEFQVVRHFLYEHYARKSCTPNQVISEAVQVWIDSKGKKTIMALPRHGLSGGYSDNWKFGHPMKIRYPYNNYYMTDPYDIWASYIYPYYSLIPILRRNGFTLKADANPCEVMQALLQHNEAEMLIKTKQFSLLKYFYCNDHLYHRLSKWLHAVKICNRNNYIVRDASMWNDYLELLEYFQLDTHNAHYVCPKNLKAEHDRLMHKRERCERIKEVEARKKKIRQEEEAYIKRVGDYLSLDIHDRDIKIQLIPSVAEMYEEGESMHHCVYINEYYKKKNSLIFSARNKKDYTRIETIELNLLTLKIVQCRGKFNKNTSYHNHIIELMEKNINQIKEIKYKNERQFSINSETNARGSA